MKQFWTKLKANLYEWFVASNRWVHLMVGWAIFIVMAFAIGVPQGMQINTSSVIIGAYLATLIAMVGVEIKDKLRGSAFDIKDVNAGMLLGNLVLIVYLICRIN